MANGITDQEAEVIIYIERICSVFSLLGCIFVLATFSFSPAFRNRAINRLVFLATFGNMLTNVATLMTRTFTLDVDSFGCQFQGFLIQVFMQGDAYWALAMAINVYLTFYHKYDARALRRMEIYYVAACYGIPFIPGFVFLFITREGMGRPYGNAVLWCWFKKDWDVLRIATFYGPVWVSIVVTMAIYIRAGRDIYTKRKKMLRFRSGSGSGTANGTQSGVNLDNGFFPPNDFFSYKTTEVTHTTEVVRPAASLGPVATKGPSHGPAAAQPAQDGENNVSYSVTISADKPADRDSMDEEEEIALTPIQSNSPTNAPGSANGNGLSFPTDVATQQHQQRQQHQARRRHEANSATWPYVKCAMLFFSALLITWIPSSGNRVYSLMNKNEISKPLFFASAFVLPLQGFWNAIIYMFTSWAACKSLWATILLSLPSWMTGGGGSRRQIAIVEIASRNDPAATGRNKQMRLATGSSMKWNTSKGEESTSMEDLTGHGGGLGNGGVNGYPRTGNSRDTMDRVSPV
ncbi:hypothetical protein QBC37DRAFT_371850 [Rhypophila decipiens]|uniref:G-protein coupled receptors family 2 profile 2 domain-containing protein n=1 Tax=Rhypophila decipiens TaxID=261697 RepID=A0AAN6YCY8_9PEZI|nr:hypothetical protein QBC37DRAFT_371850 [Rhypophila decipiens]